MAFFFCRQRRKKSTRKKLGGNTITVLTKLMKTCRNQFRYKGQDPDKVKNERFFIKHHNTMCNVLAKNIFSGSWLTVLSSPIYDNCRIPAGSGEGQFNKNGIFDALVF